MKIPNQHAFSLVEVVIAIGIISFALLAIMGLMATSQKSDREATDDTLLPAMAAGALDELRLGPFPPSPATFYFNSAGTLQTNGTGPISSSDANSLYRCEVKISGGVAVASDKMKILQMRFFRPPSPSNTNASATIHASLSEE
jgi:type II secretory pathway pseudopilin PulG